MTLQSRRFLVLIIALSAALNFSTGALALDEGTYRVEGHGPGAEEAYTGEAQLKRTGDTYTVVWRIGEGRHVGTGILTDNVFSVFFQPLERGAAAGVASFRVVGNKVADGTWTVLGSQVVGVERWTLEGDL
jgi:hypothetical protein